MTIDEQRHLLRCGVARSDVDKLELPMPTTAMLATASFAAGKRSVLVLAGAVGTGKTLAAAHWLLNAKRWADADQWSWDVDSSAFVKASRLFRLNLRFGPERELFDRYCRMRWLAVDDLGLEVADRNIVDQFFDERCSRQVKTAITTNLVCPTPKRPDCAFKEAYGDRVVSRMAQNGTFAHTGTLDLRRSR